MGARRHRIGGRQAEEGGAVPDYARGGCGAGVAAAGVRREVFQPAMSFQLLERWRFGSVSGLVRDGASQCGAAAFRGAE